MNSDMMHAMMIDYLKARLSREYDGITINPNGNPDMVLSQHGLVLANLEVETEKTVTPSQAEQWQALSEAGPRLILMVPKSLKVKATELLWQKGLAGKVGVGTYEIAVSMP